VISNTCGASFAGRWTAAATSWSSPSPISEVQPIVPALTQVTQSVLAAASGTYRYPWQNLFDLRFSKIIRSGGVKIEPTADLFNVFNSSAVTSQVNTIGPSLLRPSGITFARMLRLGVHGTF